LQRSPNLPCGAAQKEEAIIRFNIKIHGVESLWPKLAESLNAHLEDYDVYSMSKRYDNLNLWAKYAADHTGYCLEFANEGPLFKFAKDLIYEDSAQVDIARKETSQWVLVFLQAHGMEQ